ncbi:MAG: hypothetical protein GY715_07080 [Planctomycetes bacterium]|nr:hypothetical protein [Planctomycetota bacterium]
MLQGDYFNQTLLHPLGLAAVLVFGVMMLLVPRRFSLVPMLLMACFVSSAQRFVVFGLDFNLLRLMVLLGWLRIAVLNEWRGFRWKRIDTVVVLWALSGVVVSSLREMSMANLVYRAGFTYDAFGMYFLCRVLVRGWRDVETFILAAGVISVPVAGAFLLEQATGRNIFSVFGGVSPITEVRDGRIRCRGPFSHPIYAGCFWASLMPCFIALFWQRGHRRWLSAVALLASLLIIATTASSTPALAIVAVVVAMALFPLRGWMSAIRWSAAVGLVILHLVMQAPVWHLISRVDVIAGSTGWYRYKLIDGFIRNFDLWFLTGSRAYERIWGETYRAVTNHFIFEGVEGGLLTLALFVAIVVLAFRGAGRLCRCEQRRPAQRMLAWALGASLFVHCVDFTAVSYFGQVLLVWYACLGFIASLAPEREASRVTVRVVAAPALGHPTPSLP